MSRQKDRSTKSITLVTSWRCRKCGWLIYWMMPLFYGNIPGRHFSTSHSRSRRTRHRMETQIGISVLQKIVSIQPLSRDSGSHPLPLYIQCMLLIVFNEEQAIVNALLQSGVALWAFMDCYYHSTYSKRSRLSSWHRSPSIPLLWLHAAVAVPTQICLKINARWIKLCNVEQC